MRLSIALYIDGLLYFYDLHTGYVCPNPYIITDTAQAVEALEALRREYPERGFFLELIN